MEVRVGYQEEFLHGQGGQSSEQAAQSSGGVPSLESFKRH